MDQLLLVEWFDSHVHSGPPWCTRAEGLPDPEPIITIGFLLRQTPEWLTLYQSTWKDTKDNDVCSVYHIPMGCIKSIDIITEYKLLPYDQFRREFRPPQAPSPTEF